MADGRQRSDWQRTAHLLALLYNINRGKGDPKTPADFFPFKDGTAREKPMKGSFDMLKAFFVKPDGGEPVKLTPPNPPAL